MGLHVYVCVCVCVFFCLLRGREERGRSKRKTDTGEMLQCARGMAKQKNQPCDSRVAAQLSRSARRPQYDEKLKFCKRALLLEEKRPTIEILWHG